MDTVVVFLMWLMPIKADTIGNRFEMLFDQADKQFNKEYCIYRKRRQASAEAAKEAAIKTKHYLFKTREYEKNY